jgi:hypothetical protein
MQNQLPSTPARRALRARRARRRLTAFVGAGAITGILATTGFVVASPSVAAAMPVLSPASAASLAAESIAAQPIQEATAAARSALAKADVALAEADAVTASVSDSGLVLDADKTEIDTRALREAAGRLSDLDVLPLLQDPRLTDEVTAAAKSVSEDAGEVRELLNERLAQRAAETAAAVAAAEAAAQAQREAEAAAAAAAAAEAAAFANTPEGAQQTARRMAADRYGWGDGQFSCLQSLWNKESSWNYQAYNDSSGATGIPQALPGSKMASAGADWQTSATTQIAWGLDYISRAYGTPCNAWGHSQATDWY